MKFLYITLALFLGGMGLYKFYIGKWIMGILYFLFSWTFSWKFGYKCGKKGR